MVSFLYKNFVFGCFPVCQLFLGVYLYLVLKGAQNILLHFQWFNLLKNSAQYSQIESCLVT